MEAKVSGGLGVEVYYHPSLPVRAADLLVNEVRTSCASALTSGALDETFVNWIRLMADLLTLGYMPYAPWNHGMGACVDAGNACIDGGFNDLLTIVPFDSIPNEHLFWRALAQSIQMLAGSIVAMCSAAANMRPQPEPAAAAVAYVTERLREQFRLERRDKESANVRLLRFFDVPSADDVFRHLREMHRDGSSAQFGWPAAAEARPDADSRSELPETLGV
jgi:hypothetical protein